ncbi:MAG: DeoR/GlpR family DNA-binding transcription regulator [Oscillospiraceae bacterium]|nr:DeoR/GlpR family DNA-binding transcription regulator [Oscillospiraceae bacterium]
MLKIERQNLIDQEIRKAGYVLVPSLSRLLNCSEETVRRDLKEMESDGRLVRTHGGAYLVEKYDKGYPIELRKSYLQRTKEYLAEAAVAEIRENDVVMLDASTTCLAIAEAILKHDMNITLITNSLEICLLFREINSAVNLIVVGGTFRRRTSSFADPNTVEALRRYYADKAFISCPKLNEEFGLSDNHISEANVRRQMLKNSRERILVVDHTKFEGNGTVLFDGLEDVNIILTDQEPSERFLKYADAHGIVIRYSQE